MCYSFVKIELLRNKKFKDRKCALNYSLYTDVAIFFFSIIGERETRQRARSARKKNKELVVFIFISFFPHLYPLTLAVI